jgi:hypothetical protein
MATAIPPKAAEVASSRPVRQKAVPWVGAGSAGFVPRFWSMGMGPVVIVVRLLEMAIPP